MLTITNFIFKIIINRDFIIFCELFFYFYDLNLVSCYLTNLINFDIKIISYFLFNLFLLNILILFNYYLINLIMKIKTCSLMSFYCFLLFLKNRYSNIH